MDEATVQADRLGIRIVQNFMLTGRYFIPVIQFYRPSTTF